MDYRISLVIVPLAIGFWNLAIAILGLFPQFLSTAVGTLTDAKTRKNVRTRHGRIIPVLTRFGYTYTVKGKEYRYTGQELYSKRRLLPKTTMVFVKWFPRHAYPGKFMGSNEWALGLTCLFMGLMVIWAITIGE